MSHIYPSPPCLSLQSRHSCVCITTTLYCPHRAQMTVGDFNNDGNPDVATAHTGTKALSVLFGDGR